MSGSGPTPQLELAVLPAPHALLRLDPGVPLPAWVAAAGAEPAGLVSVTRTAEELSIVCPERLVPADQRDAGPRRAIRVSGTLDHALTGILASLSTTLADAGIPIFAISTWDTDYLLVEAADLGRAVAALERAGHRVADAEA